LASCSGGVENKDAPIMPHGTVDAQDKRIMEILGTDEIWVNQDLLAKYNAHLKANITIPCLLTGTEDFPWEEFYVMGPGSKKEYEILKKTQPSYTDTYELVAVNDEIEEDRGLFVDVVRVSDKKKFSLRLDLLKCKDKKSPNFQLIDDYNIWFGNYR